MKNLLSNVHMNNMNSSVWFDTVLAIALSHDTTHTGMEGRELHTSIDYKIKCSNCSNVNSIITRWDGYTHAIALLSVINLVILSVLLHKLKKHKMRLCMSSYGPPYNVHTD